MKRIFKWIGCAAVALALVLGGGCTESSDDEPRTEQNGSGQTPGSDEEGEEETPDEPGTPDPEEPADDPLADGKLCILAIGNSFSQDAVEQYLWELFDAAGIEAMIGNMYIGGCPLEKHWSNAQSDAAAYAYRKVVGGVKRETKNVALSTALADEAWDIVTLQQASGDSGLYETYVPYLSNLIGYLQERVDAQIWFHQTWAYAQSSNHADFPSYGNDQMTMYRAIVSAVQQAFADNASLAGVIPSGTAIQNARTSFLGDTFNRDGYHLETTYGRYTAACTWFEALSGESAVGNTYAPATIDAQMTAIAQHAAHAAVEQPYEITTLVDYEHPQVDDGPVEAAIYVDFGSKSSGTPWNNITTADAADITLKDAEDRYTQAVLSIDPAFSTVYAGVSGEPESDIVSQGITWPRMVWVDGLTVTGTPGEGDSDPATIVISGLQPTQKFDVTVLATRYNGTRTARTTDYQLVGATQTGGRISQGIRLGSGTGLYPSWEEVPFEEYALTFAEVAPAADGTLRLTVRGVDVGSTVVEGHISALCLAPAE